MSNEYDMVFNLQSTPQLRKFLFDFCNMKSIKKTEGGKTGNVNDSTDESVLLQFAEKENNEFCKLLLQYRKLKKARGTYVKSILRYIQERNINGELIHLIHPDFALNIVETYRSSANNPNLQNIAKHGDIITFLMEDGTRDKKRSVEWNLFRKVFTSQGLGYWLAEVDYEGAEVKTAANLSLDPVLIDDLNHDMDMHSHWTNLIFEWDFPLRVIKEKYKEERQITKNNWTFANFYGAGPNSMGASFLKFDIFKEFVLKKFKEQRNREQGFNTFADKFAVEHFVYCQEVFWERYKVHKAWQNQLVSDYYETGYVETLLGFRRYHPLKRNEILNTPIQSISFHLLLNSIIEVQKEIITNHWQSKQIGQIHDSGLSMVPTKELYAYKEMVDDKMINHSLPIPKAAKLGTDWTICKTWDKPISFPFKQFELSRN